MPFLLNPCRNCGHKHYTDQLCVKLAVKPSKDVKPDVKPSVRQVVRKSGTDMARRGDDSPVVAADHADVVVGVVAPRQWRHRDPEAYRAYMREYMKRKRADSKTAR